MAEEGQGGPETKVVEVPEKKGKLMLVLMIAGALGVGAGGTFFVMRSAGGEVPAAEVQTEAMDGVEAEDGASPGAQKVDPKGAPALGPTVKLAPFVLNLNEPEVPRYLKLTLVLELDSEKLQEEVEQRRPQIRDAVVSYISNLSLEDTRGSRAKDDMRANLLRRINAVLSGGRVVRIFITEFMIQ